VNSDPFQAQLGLHISVVVENNEKIAAKTQKTVTDIKMMTAEIQTMTTDVKTMTAETQKTVTVIQTMLQGHSVGASHYP
jgi:methyl-accepting chemotaxis protein